MKYKNDITQDELKEFITYDKKTGLIKYKNPLRKGQKKPDHVSDGYLDPSGYIMLFIKDKSYRAHRLAWLYVTGNFPKEEIDHINGIRNDNRYVNLREVTRQQNKFNNKRKGYYYDRSKSRYRASIQLNNKMIHLGYFKEKSDARDAYVKAKIKHHGEEFSRRIVNE